MTGLVKAALVKIAYTALRLSDGFDAGHAARTVLVKMAVPMWMAAGAFQWWHIEGGPDWAGGLVGIAAALAITGTIVASIRWYFTRYGGAAAAQTLLEALLATPPQQKADLRVVSEIESATRSSTPAPRRTAR